MVLALATAQSEAVVKTHVMRRLFIYCEAVDPVTGDQSPAGFWNDAGTVEIEGRVYFGSGTVIKVHSLGMSSDLSVTAWVVTLSGLAPEVANLVRAETVGQKPIDLKIGIFDTVSRDVIGELVTRFRGFVNDVEIVTPAAGGDSVITLTCESIFRAATLRRFDTRSHASEVARDADDEFYSYTDVQREKPLYFGRPGP